MPEEQPQDQISFLLSDFNARLRDTEEKNRVLKERIVILGNNILTLKDNLDSSISELKKDVSSLKKDVGNIKNLLENFVNESNSFVRKDEVALIERMLKDFYPIDFARVKDLPDLIKEEVKLLVGKSLGHTSEEHKKLNEHINNVISHIAKTKTKSPNKSKKAKNIK